MNYFSVQFEADWAGGGADPQTQEEVVRYRKFIEHEREVEDKLTEAGLNWLHAYSFPDGSIYKYIKTELDERALRDVLKTHMPGLFMDIRLSDPIQDPHKYNCKTLEEYFSKG